MTGTQNIPNDDMSTKKIPNLNVYYMDVSKSKSINADESEFNICFMDDRKSKIVIVNACSLEEIESKIVHISINTNDIVQPKMFP